MSQHDKAQVQLPDGNIIKITTYDNGTVRLEAPERGWRLYALYPGGTKTNFRLAPEEVISP